MSPSTPTLLFVILATATLSEAAPRHSPSATPTPVHVQLAHPTAPPCRSCAYDTQHTLRACEGAFCSACMQPSAFEAKVDVRCEFVPKDAAPALAACQTLLAQAEAAAAAVTTQFRAYACTQVGCCSKTDTHVEAAVEAAMYPTFPIARLPIDACNREDVEEDVLRDMCVLCQAVVTVAVSPLPCDHVRAGVLADRCRQVSAAVRWEAARLQHHLQAAVCGCLGCCDGPCVFEDRTWDWLSELQM